MFETLLSQIQWKQQQNVKYGTSEKRLTAWFSDYGYKYSGVLQQPNKTVSFQDYVVAVVGEND